MLNRPGVFATPVPRLIMRGRKQEWFVLALPEVPGVGGLSTHPTYFGVLLTLRIMCVHVYV